ncbi:hypothetical protein B566_EDAN003009 [Ephemera danica]|nr:hypothetical protein B566_EDAN003009 [Ephemera danica]
MTTAARPTFEPARGGQGRGEKDLSAMSKQYSSRDLPSHTKLKYSAAPVAPLALPSSSSVAGSSKRPRMDQVSTANLDADDPIDEDDSDDSDSDADDTAQLLAELQRIKKERAAEQARKEADRRMEEERIRMENILSGNPLLNYSAQAPKGDLKIKRRWDDDVVFKNCARSEPNKNEPQFINDSLRSDFHRKFMEKYIK